MQISILVQGSPTSTRACHTALDFANSVVDSEHDIFRVFFYQDAVTIGARYLDTSPDEPNLQSRWVALGKHQNFELVLCVSAAQRRGISQDVDHDTIADGFAVSGLGQLIEAMLESDRLVSFTA
ncbi:MAG: sulfurtransferase complex subunit TusD [Gammaproteobacteria bacterium]|nr:sulfurtransferase complex subunit TusD [Gammaproteobacteria bacterium]